MKYTDLLFAALLIGVASYSLWRVMAVDTITKPARRWLFTEHRDDHGGKLYKWLKLWYKCPWCAGAWVTALVTILVDVTTSLPLPLLVFAAARAVCGWIGGHDEDYQSQMMKGEP